MYVFPFHIIQSEFNTQKLAVEIRPWTKLFHMTLKFYPIIKLKIKGFDHLTKTMLAHIPSFKIIGIYFTYQRCFSRSGMDNRTRDVIYTRQRPQLSPLVFILFTLLWCHFPQTEVNDHPTSMREMCVRDVESNSYSIIFYNQYIEYKASGKIQPFLAFLNQEYRYKPVAIQTPQQWRF